MIAPVVGVTRGKTSPIGDDNLGENMAPLFGESDGYSIVGDNMAMRYWLQTSVRGAMVWEGLLMKKRGAVKRPLTSHQDGACRVFADQAAFHEGDISHWSFDLRCYASQILP